MRTEIVDFYLHRMPDFRAKWWLLKLFSWLFENTVTRSRYGAVKLMLQPGDRTNRYCVLGLHGEVIADQIGRMNEGDCFIDVGANCGVFSFLAGRRVGTRGLVISFEPCLATFSRLALNAQLNGLNNVLMFNLAVTDRTRTQFLDTSARGHSGKFALIANDNGKAQPVMTIAMADFEGLAALIANRRTVVKVDVEGAELSALRGLEPFLRREETHKVIVEIDAANLSRFGATPAEVCAYLKQFGFSPEPAPSRDHYDQVFTKGGCGQQPPRQGARQGSPDLRGDEP